MTSQTGNVRFVRIRGRIVPVRGNKAGSTPKTKVVSDTSLSKATVAREGFLSGLGSGGASVLGGGSGYEASKHVSKFLDKAASKGGRFGKIASNSKALGALKFGSKLGLVGLGYGAFYSAYSVLTPKKGQLRTVPVTPGGRM